MTILISNHKIDHYEENHFKRVLYVEYCIVAAGCTVAVAVKRDDRIVIVPDVQGMNRPHVAVLLTEGFQDADGLYADRLSGK